MSDYSEKKGTEIREIRLALMRTDYLLSIAELNLEYAKEQKDILHWNHEGRRLKSKKLRLERNLEEALKTI